VDVLGRSRTLLDGGPCRDRTYDQLIKSSAIARALLPSKTITYASSVVPRIADFAPIRPCRYLGRLCNGTSRISVRTEFVELPIR
jgi:hypothetical protein